MGVQMEETDQTPSQKVGPLIEATSRLDIVSGPTGRRRWALETKARIVAESFNPGVSVSAVARRHKVRTNQLFAWRRLARDGKLVLPADAVSHFVPAMLEAPTVPPSCGGKIEIEAAGVVVRLAVDVPAARIGAIASALRAG